jgi:hypothetical protein
MQNDDLIQRTVQVLTSLETLSEAPASRPPDEDAVRGGESDRAPKRTGSSEADSMRRDLEDVCRTYERRLGEIRKGQANSRNWNRRSRPGNPDDVLPPPPAS